MSGTAFIFSKSSVLILTERGSIVFQNNHASHYGAAFYIVTEEFVDTSTYINDLVYSPVSITLTSTFCEWKGLDQMYG